MAEARCRIESLPTRTDRPDEVFGPLQEHLRLAAGSSWSQDDRIAATFLHLGNPEAARRLWAEAANAPSPAWRLTRMAVPTWPRSIPRPPSLDAARP